MKGVCRQQAPEEVAGGPEFTATESGCPHVRLARIGWAGLLKRVFAIDFDQCPNCGAQIKLIAANLESAVIGSSRTRP